MDSPLAPETNDKVTLLSVTISQVTHNQIPGGTYHIGLKDSKFLVPGSYSALLTASVGIGANRLTAKLGSEHENPDGLMVIHPSPFKKQLAAIGSS